MKTHLIIPVITAILLFTSPPVWSQTAEQEQRASALYKEVRCPVCTVQSVSESDATLSQNLRKKIMEQIIAGQSDAEILKSLSDTYGDDVRLMPKTEVRTLPLWLAPWAVIILGSLGIMIVRRGRNSSLEDETEADIS